MPDIKTEQVIFSGKVQGVGFRYTVRSIAKRHPVKGYVKNMSDATVELMMQGAASEMNALVAEVAEYFRNNIDDCQRRTLVTDEEFMHFEIRS
jgi:acylphosphatase